MRRKLIVGLLASPTFAAGAAIVALALWAYFACDNTHMWMIYGG